MGAWEGAAARRRELPGGAGDFAQPGAVWGDGGRSKKVRGTRAAHTGVGRAPDPTETDDPPQRRATVTDADRQARKLDKKIIPRLIKRINAAGIGDCSSSATQTDL